MGVGSGLAGGWCEGCVSGSWVCRLAVPGHRQHPPGGEQGQDLGPQVPPVGVLARVSARRTRIGSAQAAPLAGRRVRKGNALQTTGNAGGPGLPARLRPPGRRPRTLLVRPRPVPVSPGHRIRPMVDAVPQARPRRRAAVRPGRIPGPDPARPGRLAGHRNHPLWPRPPPEHAMTLRRALACARRGWSGFPASRGRRSPAERTARPGSSPPAGARRALRSWSCRSRPSRRSR